MSGRKTVLVVGAGLSAPAGIPTQRELLRQMYEHQVGVAEGGFSYHQPRTLHDDGIHADLLSRDISIHILGISYDEAMERVKEFIERFFIPITGCDRLWHEVPLEDVYSVLDRAINEGDSLPPYSAEQLIETRHALDGCIAQFLRSKVDGADHTLYRKLYHSLVERFGDDWLTVSTNWDMLWDRVLQECSGKDLSYGIDVFRLQDSTLYRIPAETDGPRIYKLHGSLDWLVCPCCHSVFVSDRAPGTPCPRCGDASRPGEPLLRGSLLTPTMLKSLRNPTMRLIHDEAFHELRRADRVIFVGYSLPEADHDLRYLFRRAIPATATIDVVFVGTNEDPLVSRYKQLFGLDERCFNCNGFEQFFSLE